MQSILKDYFIQKSPNIGDEIEGFCQLFVPKIIKNKEFLLQVGEVCEYKTFDKYPKIAQRLTNIHMASYFWGNS